MIAALVLALALGTSCDVPLAKDYTGPKHDTVCVLAEQPALRTAPNRAKLEEIYARDRLQHARDRNSGLVERYLQRFFEWVGELFETTGAARYADSTRFLVLFLAALAGGFGLLKLLGTRSRRRTQPSGDLLTEGLSLQLSSPETHLVRARDLLSPEPRAALREGLLALLSQLERERWAPPDRVKTNHEVATELSMRGGPTEFCAAVHALMRSYDDLFYSLSPVSAEAAGAFIARVDAQCSQPTRKAA